MISQIHYSHNRFHSKIYVQYTKVLWNNLPTFPSTQCRYWHPLKANIPRYPKYVCAYTTWLPPCGLNSHGETWPKFFRYWWISDKDLNRKQNWREDWYNIIDNIRRIGKTYHKTDLQEVMRTRELERGFLERSSLKTKKEKGIQKGEKTINER